MTYEATSGSAYGSRTVTGFFDDQADAQRAVEKLIGAGIPRTDVSLVAGNSAGSSAQTSANEGGFFESLSNFFMPDEDRYTYAEGLRRGGYVVTARVDGASYERALDILDDEGTVNIGERETSWRSEGWGGYTGATGTASASIGRTGRTDGEEVIELAEEELKVGKRDVSHGRVRVRSYVVETPVSEAVNLREENVTVQRRSVDRPLSATDRLFENRTIEVEEHAEEAVVAKEARVREEIVVNKEVGERTETISDTVRRTEVEIEDDRGTTGTVGGTRRTI